MAKQKAYREYSREYREYVESQQKLFFNSVLTPMFNDFLKKSLDEGTINQEEYEKFKGFTWKTIPLDWVRQIKT